jgi:hypothetical protein
MSNWRVDKMLESFDGYKIRASNVWKKYIFNGDDA